MLESLPVKGNPRRSTGSLPVRGASLHNLKCVDVDIPLGIMTVVTGVAGSGKSTLITQVFARQYEQDVVMIDQGPITATNRSTPASYLGFFDEIRKLLARESGKPDGLFSFNSTGRLPGVRRKGRDRDGACVYGPHRDGVRGLRRATLQPGGPGLHL